jgi:hypothetical protein
MVIKLLKLLLKLKFWKYSFITGSLSFSEKQILGLFRSVYSLNFVNEYKIIMKIKILELQAHNRVTLFFWKTNVRTSLRMFILLIL